MLFKSETVVTIATACLVVLTISLTGPSAVAEKPDPVIRTFGYYATGAFEGPDFLADDSVGITVLPDLFLPSSGQTIEFSATDNNPEWLRGTVWAVHPAHHATKGGDELNGVFLWLLDEETPTAPPIGAHTLTGPDGLIDDQVPLRIAPCSGTDCEFGEGSDRWVVQQTNVGVPFVVVTAVFSR